jgi:non-specific serine/threonine protein kinase
MLETVRDFARELAAAAGEESAARLRHGEWVVQFLAGEHDNLLHTRTRQAAHERIASEETGIRAALHFAASADGDHELAWELFVRYGVALMIGAQTVEVLTTYESLAELPRSADRLRAARALGVWSWARAAVYDSAADPDLDAACTVLENAGERDFLMCFQTAWGMLLAPTTLPRALAILDRALTLARAAGQTAVENFALMMICFAHINAGAVEEAQRSANEFASVAQHRLDDEAMAYALLVDARVKLMRGDLARARSLFADAAALAGARAEAWSRRIALCGLASVTFAAGDEVGARAILEEALVVCVGAGYLGMDSLCGAMALLLVKTDERDRAARVFDAVAVGTENETNSNATSTDPTGALRTATREARALLGDPTPPDPATVDLDAVLQAALGSSPKDLTPSGSRVQ